MRKDSPSWRWLKRFDAAFVAQGGHNGPQTIMMCREKYAIPLYQRGATPSSAGWAAALASRRYREIKDLEEILEWEGQR